MPIDLRPLVAPAHTAVLVIECQLGVLGEDSPVPDLARSVREGTLVPTLAGFLDGARAAGARVVHCTVEPGASDSFANSPLGARTRGRGGISSAILPELGPDPRDVVAPRDRGLTIFHETGLDAKLRGAGIRTVVLTGVSVNIAITGAAIGAVERGFTVVIPGDCVAGFPASFASDVLRYSLRNLAVISSARQICEAWA